jgi:arylsulfatase A-like enzyme
MITRMDKDIGRIFDLLKTLDLDENTIVFFASDNGGVKGMSDFFTSNGVLRGYKTDIYEGGIRAPLIARWPGKVTAGSVSNHISAFWDMMPTFCEIAEISAPANIDGISFLPELIGEQQKEHEHLVWEYFHYNYGWKPGSEGPRNELQSQAVRMGKWKGVRENIRNNPNAPLELYDLSKDFSEQNNLAEQFPDVVAQIQKIMQDEHTDSEFFKVGFDR